MPCLRLARLLALAVVLTALPPSGGFPKIVELWFASFMLVLCRSAMNVFQEFWFARSTLSHVGIRARSSAPFANGPCAGSTLVAFARSLMMRRSTGIEVLAHLRRPLLPSPVQEVQALLPFLGLASGTLPFTERCASSLSSVHTFGRGAHFTHPVAWGTPPRDLLSHAPRVWRELGLASVPSSSLSVSSVGTSSSSLSVSSSCSLSVPLVAVSDACQSKEKQRKAAPPSNVVNAGRGRGEPLSMCLDSVSGGVGVRRVASSST